ncbi:circadian clock KaiB family protein [Desulfonatronum parangueonense]
MTEQSKPLDSTEAFEAALLQMQKGQPYRLRLFVSGMTPTSLRAITTIQEICDQHLQGICDLEVIDIHQNPERGRQDQIVAAPTLVKQLPEPLRKFVGDLSDKDKILVGLDLVPQGRP